MRRLYAYGGVACVTLRATKVHGSPLTRTRRVRVLATRFRNTPWVGEEIRQGLDRTHLK